jgi:hypothetical protein
MGHRRGEEKFLGSLVTGPVFHDTVVRGAGEAQSFQPVGAYLVYSALHLDRNRHPASRSGSAAEAQDRALAPLPLFFGCSLVMKFVHDRSPMAIYRVAMWLAVSCIRRKTWLSMVLLVSTYSRL